MNASWTSFQLALITLVTWARYSGRQRPAYRRVGQHAEERLPAARRRIRVEEHEAAPGADRTRGMLEALGPQVREIPLARDARESALQGPAEAMEAALQLLDPARGVAQRATAVQAGVGRSAQILRPRA